MRDHLNIQLDRQGEINSIKCTFQQSYFNLIKLGIGSGILVMPYLFKLFGLSNTLIMMLWCAFLSYFSWNSLSKSLDESECQPKLLVVAAHQYFSRPIIIYYYLACYLFLFSTMCSYTIYIYGCAKQILQNTLFIDYRIIVTLLLAPVLTLISSIHDLQKYAKYSQIIFSTQIGVFLILLIVSLTEKNVRDTLSEQAPQQKPSFFSSFPLMYGILLFTYDVNGMVTEIKNSMQQPVRFGETLLSYLVSYIILILIFAGTLQSVYGNAIQEIIFNNLQNKIIAFFLKFVYGIILGYGLILNAYPIADKILEYTNDLSHQYYWVYAGIYAGTIIIANLYPYLIKVLNITGCLFSVSLGFVFPYILFLQIRYDKVSENEKLVNLFVFLCGICGGALGFYYSI